MKKYLKLESLTAKEVPQDLDLRILAAGKLRAGTTGKRRKRLRWTISTAAAAAGLLIAAGICFVQPEAVFQQKISMEEYSHLMAMTDWTDIEQENYNLSGEINCGTKSGIELAGNRFIPGGLEL